MIMLITVKMGNWGRKYQKLQSSSGIYLVSTVRDFLHQNFISIGGLAPA